MNKFTFEKYSSHNNVLIGEGVKDLLEDFKLEVPELVIKSEPTGAIFGDWTIPQEWINNGGYLRSLDGSINIDLLDHPLRLVQYSNPFHGELKLNDLLEFLYFDERNNDALPYITNYYGNSFGVCVTQNEYQLIKNCNEDFELFIHTSFKDGHLYYGECILKGALEKEVLISSYLCHPWMANNELSGPILLLELIKILRCNNPCYTYRFILIPETLGSILYINKNLNLLKNNVLFGLNLTCIGDNREFSMVATPSGVTEIDEIVSLSLLDKSNSKLYSWLERGSDERQFNSPNVELNVVTLCRSKFGTFKEYHSSNDCYGKTVNETGMSTSLEWLKEIIWLIENNGSCWLQTIGEPFMSKYNLYPMISIVNVPKNRQMMNFLSLCNGRKLVEIARILRLSILDLITVVKVLKENNLIVIKVN